MSEKANIIDALKRFIQRQIPPMAVVCTVDDVDMTDLTCYCIPINGDADIKDVRLMAQADNPGFILIPKIGSVVVIEFIDDANGYVSMVSQVQEVKLNGDNYNGLVRVTDLVTKLNNLENNVNELRTAINGWTPVPNDGGAALKVAAATWLTHSLTNTVQADIENITVKHGNGT